MNTDLMFRAWDDGKMIYSSEGGKYSHAELKNFFNTIREDSIVMKCTGLRDKNDKLIYESDILKTSDGSICYVVFADTGFAVKTTGSEAIDWEFGHFYSECEVIGNIY